MINEPFSKTIGFNSEGVGIGVELSIMYIIGCDVVELSELS